MLVLLIVLDFIQQKEPANWESFGVSYALDNNLSRFVLFP